MNEALKNWAEKMTVIALYEYARWLFPHLFTDAGTAQLAIRHRMECD